MGRKDNAGKLLFQPLRYYYVIFKSILRLTERLIPKISMNRILFLSFVFVLSNLQAQFEDVVIKVD
ncbi:MAG: hypothetical protein AAFY00_10695, partial [Bacteroidota bacterium]